MSVVVLGMEMPEKCEDCFCYRHNAEYDYAYCNISSVNVLGHGRARLNNCPLIPLPERHGDLVDISQEVIIQYYDDMYQEWSLKAGTVEDALLVCEEFPMTIVEAEGD